MIMPNKVVKPNHSLLYIGGFVLESINKGNKKQYLDDLYSCVKSSMGFNLSLERFILTLDFLYIVGKIKLDNEVVVLCD